MTYYPSMSELDKCAEKDSKRTLLSLRNIYVKYQQSRKIFSINNSYEAIKDASFDVYSGDSLGIIGRNGAGKSSLLRVIGGIIEPDSGVLINNNAQVALLALQAGFDTDLDGRSNALLSGILLGFTPKQVKEKLDRIIEFAELGNFIDQPVKTYSTGMVARLAFSVAHMLEPDVLLVDEVLSVGDVEFREKSLDVMRKKLLSDQTIILVSHDTETIKSFCNRVVWIENGFTKMVGSADEVVGIYEEYTHRKAFV